MNVKALIKYDGSKYYGSQKQPHHKTIESTLEKALNTLNIDTKLIFSGRTDKGVHASGQVISFLIPDFWQDLQKLKDKLNSILPNSVYIRSIQECHKDFHARFSASKRSYRYIVSTSTPSPFNADYITYIEDINITRIKEAIKLFKGSYDFKNFCKEGSDPNSTLREIYEAKFYKYKGVYIFKFSANGFLRSQIRLMVGFLLAISKGDKTIEDLKEHLNNMNIKRVYKKPAASNGLYLSKVYYNPR